MADTWVKSGQVLGFKTGLQSAVDTILAAGSGAVHGAFYLTQDTHRLYVGNEDTSLSPVNEGVTTVANLNGLPTPSGADARKALTGQFYYITNENILAVYNGSNWIRINNNTNDTISTYNYQVDLTNNLMQGTIGDTGNHTATARFKVAAGDGVSVSYGTTNVTINSATVAVPTITVNADYEIGVVTESSKTKVKLTSVSGGTSNDTSFEVKGGNDTAGNSNVTISNDSGALKIVSRDTRVNKVEVTNNATAGFDVKVSDNYNSQATNANMTANFQPKIKYGGAQANQVTVDFVNGTATLNAYTKGEVDDLMKSLNAMTYIGTYNTASSGTATAADSISTSSGNTVVSLNGNPVPMHLGDTILAAATFTLNGTTVNKGSLLIARGTEDANGEITASTLTFDIVESTVDKDTTYKFVADTNNTGILLKDSNNKDQGGLLFTGGADSDSSTITTDMIKVTKSYENTSNGASGSKIATITIKHKDVARTNSTGTAISTNRAASSSSWTGSTDVNVITGIETNASGHITGVTTTKVTIRDTNSYFSTTEGSVVTSTAFNGTDDKRVGVFTNTLKLVNPSNSNSTASGYFALTSKSLSINDDDTQMRASGGTTAASGLNIEMVWGSF